jgi:hypothetical protein
MIAVVKKVMRRKMSCGAALGLFNIPIITFQKGVEEVAYNRNSEVI